VSENFDLKTALRHVESDSFEEQAAGLDEATALLNAFGKRVVDRFVHCNDRFIIWERLYRFGPFVTEPLKEVLSQTDDPELRGLSAMVLLKLGDKTGLPVLLEIISTGEELLCLAASRLIEAHIIEAADRMIERLRGLEMAKTYHIQCLLAALERLGRALPSDLVERFHAPDVPWELRMFLEKHS